jgi:restriction endonuclease S subunit
VQFNINTGELCSVAVPVPPLEIQLAFAERLADLRSIIAQQERSLATAWSGR